MAFVLPEYYTRGAGRIFVGERNPDTGDIADTGLTFLGDASELSLDPSQEFTEHLEHQTGDGRKDVRIPRGTTLAGQLILDNTGIENFKTFLRGKLSTTTGQIITNEIHTAPSERRSFLLDHAVEVFTSLTNAGGTPYEPREDYWVEGRTIYIPEGSAAAEQSVRANYTSADVSGIDLFGDAFQEFYLFFDGLNTTNREWFSLELFKVSFDPAALGNLLGDEVVQMTIPFEALYEPLKSTSNMGGFGNFVHQLFDYFELTSSGTVIRDGDTFTVTFGTSESDFPYAYTITGVTSADIGGAPLTGTFTASGEQLTFTATVTGQKDFVLTLDNNKASVSIHLVEIVNSLSVTPSTVNQNQSFVVTFNTNYNWAYGYTITGVTSADISNHPLTGIFNNDGDTLTLTATNTINKAFTLALDDGSDSVNVTFDYVPQLYQLTSDLGFIVTGDTFTITFTTDDQESASFPYTITGINDANIGGAPLTGAFTGNGDTATFTLTDATGVSNFILSLDSGQANINLELTNPLVSSINAATYLDYFTITFRTNTPSTYPYTITGVTSADISNDSLTGTFYNDGDSVTFRATQTVDKTFTLSLDNTSASVDVVLYCTFYCPQTVPDYAIIFTIVYEFDNTNYCPQTVPDYSFAQAP